MKLVLSLCLAVLLLQTAGKADPCEMPDSLSLPVWGETTINLCEGSHTLVVCWSGDDLDVWDVYQNVPTVEPCFGPGSAIFSWVDGDDFGVASRSYDPLTHTFCATFYLQVTATGCAHVYLDGVLAYYEPDYLDPANGLGHSVCAHAHAGTIDLMVGPGLAPDQIPHLNTSPGCSEETCGEDCEGADFILYNGVPKYIPGLGMWYFTWERDYGCVGCLTQPCMCISLEGIEPVAFGQFTAIPGGGEITLRWNTLSETNVRQFELSRRAESSNTETIAVIPAQNSATGSHYSFTDRNVSGGTSYYYSLEMENEDGSRETLVSNVEATPNVSALAAEFSLSQNYPNPFNPTTTISFTLPVGDNVRYAVYNLVGQKVFASENALYSAGQHEITFDGSHLSSGIYFFRLETAAEFTASRKMMLLK